MLILLDIIAFAVVLIPGFLHVPGLNYCAYVILPYAAGILLTGYLLVVLIRLAAARDSVKAWEYDRSVKVLPTATVGAVIVVCILLVSGRSSTARCCNRAYSSGSPFGHRPA